MADATYRFAARRPKWTLILLAVIFIIFVLEFFLPLTDYFSFVPSKAFSEPWTFITSIFLHANFQHIFFNMFALFIFGTFLESRVKERDFLLIYFIAGIIGNLGYMVTAPDPNIPGLGASGAIYGIMGALAILFPFAIVYVGYVPMPMIVAAFFWGITEFLGLFVPSGIARGAHLGGLIFGILYGFYLRSQTRRLSRRVVYQY